MDLESRCNDSALTFVINDTSGLLEEIDVVAVARPVVVTIQRGQAPADVYETPADTSENYVLTGGDRVQTFLNQGLNAGGQPKDWRSFEHYVVW